MWPHFQAHGIDAKQVEGEEEKLLYYCTTAAYISGYRDYGLQKVNKRNNRSEFKAPTAI